MNRIALVEDHERLGQLVVRALAAAGIQTDLFARADQAAYAVAHAEYALMIVDRGLPDGDGLDLVKKLRSTGNRLPCLVLTARDALHDRVSGLEAGADDYLPKPFAMQELVARVRALMRRPIQMQSLTATFVDVEIRPESRSMICKTESVTLPATELQIMLTLVRAGGQTVRRTTLEKAAWSFHDVTPNALDVAIHRIRKKLDAIDSKLQIVNIRGQGYALQESQSAS
ncbi:response regulator transcription factor (plasmid) [Achromobacter seleniivolatilans]|uniref:Response regulator transcription factor n=1 Tax=Achromobacter seleniivolatilans TaxID=3047478 RepID=A0ABY9MBE1_9BURK|nr:response regulator transcription factor [Achromobacter sp. R39]WMD23914.1 response regulator transcription factor [Achromobacter sp. R39]